jgi:Domain of unknown function (DUF4160)
LSVVCKCSANGSAFVAAKSKATALQIHTNRLKFFIEIQPIVFLLMNLEQKYYICSYKLKHWTMAIISMFYGIIISMYYLDNKQHNLPHIHVKYQDEEAVISIIDGHLLEGTLKPNKMKLVQAWIEIHNEELMADWALAISGETIFKIDPLK